MIKNTINEILGKKVSLPNKFTIQMGKLIRKARNEAGITQSELSKIMYIRQASISEIENGKREISSSELVSLSYSLNKPILYFFPDQFLVEEFSDTISPLLKELILQASRLSNDDLKKIIAQTRALGDLYENKE